MAYLDIDAFRAYKGEEACAYHGLKDRDDEECEDVEDDQRVLRQARRRGGAINKYTFRMVLQIVFSIGFASAKWMYFRKLSQICFRRNT